VSLAGVVADASPDLRVIGTHRPESVSVDFELLRRVREAFPELAVLVVACCADRQHHSSQPRSIARGRARSVLDAGLFAAVLAAARGEQAAPGSGHAPLPPPGTPRELQLTAREEQVLQLLADGLTNRDIAEALAVSIKTVEVHVKHLFVKLDAGSRTQVVRNARLHGLL
jgi:DNA-binding NarL/FixJ family response regulator